MSYPMLTKMRDELITKVNKTPDDEALLKELISLDKILNIHLSSLSISDGICHSCGRPLKK